MGNCFDTKGEIEMDKKSIWKVKYQDIQARDMKRPFFNLSETTEAVSKKEAIENIKGKWDCYGHYGNYKASKIS